MICYCKQMPSNLNSSCLSSKLSGVPDLASHLSDLVCRVGSQLNPVRSGHIVCGTRFRMDCRIHQISMLYGLYTYEG